MKRNTWIAAIGIVGLVIASAAFLATSAMADSIKLKFADPSPDGQSRTIAYKQWGAWLKEKTGNKVEIEWYWADSLAKARDNINATKGGIADMCTNSSWGYHKTLFPVWQYSELLMLGPADWGAHSRAVKKLYESIPVLREELDKSGLKIIGMIGVHPTHFMTRKPVHKLEDMKGMRIRAFGPVADWLKTVGVSPVGLTIYETYEAMQKGTVDGTQTYMYINIPYKLDEVSKYAILPGIQNITVSMFMNRDVWNKLPKDVQKVFDEEAWGKLLDIGIKALDEDFNKSAEALKAKGIEFITVSPEEMARWKKTVQEPVYDKWLKDMKEKGVDGQMILDKYTEAYKEFAAKR